MEEKNFVKRRVPELDWVDLFLEILSHWRMLVLIGIIGAAAFGALGYYKNMQDENALKVDSLTDVTTNYTVESVKSELTPEQITNVEDAVYYETLLSELDLQIEYSPLFKIEASSTPMVTVTLRMVNNDTGAGANYYYIYGGILNSAEMYEYVADKCNIQGDLSKLIGLDYSAADIMTFHFNNVSVEECDKMADAFLEYADKKSATMKDSLGDVGLVLVNRASSIAFSTVISNYQKTIYDNKAVYEKRIENYQKNFSIEEIRLFKLLMMEEFGDEEVVKNSGIDTYEALAKEKLLEGKTGEDKLEDSPNTSKPSPVKKIVRLAALGLLVFEFVYVFIVGYLYAISNKFQMVDDMSFFGIKPLGKIYRYKISVFPGKFIDRLIARARRGGRKAISEADACKIITSNIDKIVDSEDIKNVALFGVSKDDSSLSKILEGLSNVNVRVMENPIHDTSKLKDLNEVDAAIVFGKACKTSYGEIWDLIELLQNRNINIIGGVVI